MKRMVSVLLILFTVHSGSVFAQTQEESFFESSPVVKLPDDEFYPDGKKFMFSIFSVLSPDLEKLKDDGFTAIGPYYGEQKKSGVLEKAHATGLKCFYRVGEHIDFVHDPNYVLPSDKEIVEQIREVMLPVVDDPSIACWYLGNEELRHWRPDEMRWLEVATQAIKQLDPLKRPIWMYEPNHRPAEGLAKTLKYQDYCGKGDYVNLAGYQNNRVWIKWSIAQQMEAIKISGKKNAVPLCVPEMCCDPEPQFHEMIPLWCRHDIYCSLVNGAKGVAIWSGFRRRGLDTYDLYYKGYSSVSRELNGELNLGEVFLFGEKKDRIKVGIIDGVKAVTLKIGLGDMERIKECIEAGRLDDSGTDYSPLSISELSYGDDVYLFIVNSASAYIKIAVSSLPQEDFKTQPLLGGEVPEIKNGIFKTELSPYDVRCYKFSKEK